MNKPTPLSGSRSDGRLGLWLISFCVLLAADLRSQPPSVSPRFPPAEPIASAGSAPTAGVTAQAVPGFSTGGGFTCSVRPVGMHINTPAAETAPFRYAERIYFCSDRDTKGCVSAQGRLFSALQWETAKPFSDIPIRKDFLISQFSFTPDASELFFSVSGCGNRKQKDLASGIYHCRKQEEGVWSAPERLPEPVNRTPGNSQEPAVGFLWASNQEVLFFSADRPDGSGKDDLWYATRGLDGTYGKPVLLPVNTPFNEQTPWFDNRSQTLYFSSDRPYGEGGFDIYRSTLLPDGSWTFPEAASVPVNSPYDDRGFFYHHASSTGYFSTNRPAAGKQIRDGFDPGDYDVYLVNAETMVELVFFNETDDQPQPNVTVRVTDLTQTSSVTQLFRLSSHGIRLPVLLGHRYEVEAIKEGFQDVVTLLEFPATASSAPIRKSIFLRPHDGAGSK